MAFLVPSDCYSLLLEKLKEDSLPRTAYMRGVIHSTIQGATSANFYTDGWPQFSALVCKLMSPRLCESRLLCYTTCKKALCEVLVKGSLVSLDGQSQMFEVDQQLTAYLTESLSVKPAVKEEVIFYYLPIERFLENALDTIQCPEGYRIGTLEAHHAELVASYWDVMDYPHKTSWMAERIKKYPSAAAFTTDDPSQPVAWALLYACLEMGSLHTLEAHRRKGLGLTVTAALCRSQMKEYPEIPPYALIEEDNVMSIYLFEKLGFVATDYKVNFWVI